MTHTPHVAYIKDVEEYLAVIEERLQEAVKRAVYAHDQRAADDIAQMQELATDLHVLVFAFLTNLRTLPPEKPPIDPSPLDHTPVGYLWHDIRDTEEEIDEEDENRITLIPDEE